MQESTSYTLQFLRYGPDKILNVKVITARSNQGYTMMLYIYTLTMERPKVKSRSYAKFCILTPLTNVFTKYQPSTPYTFQGTVQTR